MIGAAQDVLARRRKVQMDLEIQLKIAKKLNKVKKIPDASEAPVIDADENSFVEKAQIKFDNIRIVNGERCADIKVRSIDNFRGIKCPRPICGVWLFEASGNCGGHTSGADSQ